MKGARVGIVGIAFDEDVPDPHNSRVPDLIVEQRELGIAASVADLLADPDESKTRMRDGLILAVPHRVPGDAAIVRSKLCYDSVFRISA